MLACRPMLSFALAVMAGVLAERFLLPPEWMSLCGWGLFLLLTLCFLAAAPRADTPAPPGLPPAYVPHILPRPGFIARRGLNRFMLLACFACLLLGSHRQRAWRDALSLRRLPEKRRFDAVLLALEPSREYPHGGGWRAGALLLGADGENAGRVRVRLAGWRGPDFRRGDMILARVRMDLPEPAPHPGAFDRSFWLERGGHAAALYVVRGENAAAGEGYRVLPVDDPPVPVRLRRIVDSLRSHAVAATLKYGGGAGGLLATMLYGYRGELGRDVRNVFRRVGIGHVLAISGLHVGLIAGLLWWLGGFVRWPLRFRAGACLVLIVLYLGLSGGQVAAVRAATMAVLHLGAMAWGRKSDMLNSLGAAALLITLVNPTAPLDIGFQLSFTAVVFIYIGVNAARPRPRPALEPRPALSGTTLFLARLRGESIGLVNLSVATWVGLFPIVATVFHQVNLVGLPVNVVVIPLMSLVLAFGLLLPALGWIPFVAPVLVFPSVMLEWIAEIGDSLPYSSFPAQAPPLRWLLVFYAFVFLYLLKGMVTSGKARRVWLAVGLFGAATGLAGICLGMRSSPPPPEGRIALLPGGGMDTLVAEATNGSVAVLGVVRLGGAPVADWLHYRRRSGSLSVVRVGGGGQNVLDELAFHYPPASIVTLNRKERADSPGKPAWLPVPEAPGLEYAVFRDGGGVLRGLAVRTDDAMACTAANAPAALVREMFALLSVGADTRKTMISVGFSGNRVDTSRLGPAPGIVAVTGLSQDRVPSSWLVRRRYGVLETGLIPEAWE